MRRLVIIGNGMAATRLAEKLAARAQGRFIITLIGDEPQPAYNRIQLSPVLGGEKTAAQIQLLPTEWLRPAWCPRAAWRGGQRSGCRGAEAARRRRLAGMG